MVLLIFTDRLLFIGACVFVILIWNGKKKKICHGILLRPDICLIVQPSELESERDLQCFGWCYKSGICILGWNVGQLSAKSYSLSQVRGKKHCVCVWMRERKAVCLLMSMWSSSACTCSLSQAQWTEVLTVKKNDEDILLCYFALSSLTTSEQYTHTYTSLAVLLSNYSVNLFI